MSQDRAGHNTTTGGAERAALDIPVLSAPGRDTLSRESAHALLGAAAKLAGFSSQDPAVYYERVRDMLDMLKKEGQK
jgi:hypothetical protein